MRINLNCPYPDKDKAKALGAKWDSQRKIWYIRDVKDITPFVRWLPNHKKHTNKPPGGFDGRSFGITKSKVFVPHCGCQELPWEDCEHTDAMAHKAMVEMLA